MATSLEALKNNSVIPLVMANHLGEITFINQKFAYLFKWHLDEIIGEPLSVIIPKHLHDAHHMGFSRFLATEKPTLLEQPLDLLAVTKDGIEFTAKHVIYAEKKGDHWQFLATIESLK